MKMHYKHNEHLQKLHKILHFDMEDATPAPFYFFPSAYGSLSILASIISVPVILWSLFKLKRYGWLMAFFLVVIIPFTLIHYFAKSSTWYFVFMLLPVLNIILYNFILRIAVPNWKEPVFINKPGSDFK